MLGLRPYKKEDADTILSWSKDEKAFYQWSAGIMGKYPITQKEFGFVDSMMAFTIDSATAMIFVLTIPALSVIVFGVMKWTSPRYKQIQEKLIKFATRIPIFMYLTDYRESTLKDVITLLEPALFKKVTGLSVKDFALLCELNVFNATLMNDAIFKFKRYEDSSLEYSGINKHEGEDIGLYDTTISRSDISAITEMK